MKSLADVALIVVLTSMFLVAAPVVALAGGALDGKVFVTMLDGDNDVLTFQEGTFHSSSCDEWGFGKGEYTTQDTGDSISFEAMTTSEKNGNMVWTGTVQGDTIKGKYVWSKEGLFGTKTKTKNFEGTLKQ